MKAASRSRDCREAEERIAIPVRSRQDVESDAHPGGWIVPNIDVGRVFEEAPASSHSADWLEMISRPLPRKPPGSVKTQSSEARPSWSVHTARRQVLVDRTSTKSLETMIRSGVDEARSDTLDDSITRLSFGPHPVTSRSVSGIEEGRGILERPSGTM